MKPDVGALTAAIERIAHPDEWARLAEGARATREELSWERTVEDYDRLIRLATGSEAPGVTA